MSNYVDKLADLLGVVGRMGTDPPVDWAMVEVDEVGRSLPGDYKAIVDRFPAGLFQGFVKVVQPNDPGYPTGRILGLMWARLDDIKEWREDEPELFPLPLYPEPGGVLPWGQSKHGDLFGWLTDSPDPDRWTVVVADHEMSHWDRYDMSASELLIEVVTGRFDGSRFGVDLGSRGPYLKERRASLAPRTPSGYDFWRARRFGHNEIAPLDEQEAVLALLGPGSAPAVSVRWPQVESRLGVQLPDDYKNVIDIIGPGTLGRLKIVAPSGPEGFELEQLLERVREVTSGGQESPVVRPPIYPDMAGFLAWGETLDGLVCGWARTVDDPNKWGFVVIDSESLALMYQPGTSFSSALRRYATGDSNDLFEGLRDPRPPAELPRFAPARS